MAAKKRLSFSTKVAILVSAFLFAVDVGLGTGIMITSVNRMKGVIQNKVLEIALTAANLLDGDEVKSLTKADHDNETEKYMRAYNTLAAFKTSVIDTHGELAYVYCIVKTDDNKFVFSIDPSDDPGIFLEEETIYTAALYKAFEGVASFDDQSYTDRWGDLYTGYAPVFGADKTVKAVACADVWASWYQSEILTNGVSVFVLTVVTMLVGAGAVLLLSASIRKRIDALNGEMADLQNDVSELLKEIDDPANILGIDTEDENEEIGEIASLKSQIGTARIGIRKYIAHIKQQAFTDQLTGLGNRNGYFEIASKLNEKIKNGEDVVFSVLIFDINSLKEVNDTYGHEIGDDDLIAVGVSIGEAFGKERAFRIGGDEIAVVLEGMNKKETLGLVKKFEDDFGKKNAEQIGKYGFSVSKGCAEYEKGKDTDFSKVFARADKEMYKAKAKYHKATEE